ASGAGTRGTRDADAPAPRPRGRSSQRQSVGEAMMKSAARSASTVIAREGTKLGAKLVRGILGSLFGGK
ncbi:MAG: DUF853 family protein, partial [Deltaproteobacteria bacterium]|nr:DUF853 family protein [Deltaproteobacteria bacterium]